MITRMSQSYLKTGQDKTVFGKNNSRPLRVLAMVVIAMAVWFAAITATTRVLHAQSTVHNPVSAVVKEKQELTVRFRVRATGVSYRSAYDELYSEHSWEHPDAFIVQIPKNVKKQLADNGINDAARYFYGHQIDVTGEVESIEFGDLRRYILVVRRMQDIRLAPENPPVSSEDYERREVAGFTVLLNPMVAEQTTLAEQLMESIELQISGLTAQLPASRMTELQKTFIWVELDDEPDKASIYHSSSDWIVASAGNKDKLGHIEIVNAGNFVKWSRDRQSSILLHEYIHAFHHKVLGVAHQAIIDAFEQAQLRRMYDQIEHSSGVVGPGYASLNPLEYFAEISEAYFVYNDYFPFNRTQLKAHDPIGHDLVEMLWLDRALNDSPIVSE